MIVAKTKGVYYSAYEHGPATTVHKRESSSANSMKRKDPSKKAFGDTSTGFSQSAVMARSTIIDKKNKQKLVKEAEMEFKLRGKFKRVFPSIDYNYYKQFFTEERPFNAILDEKIMSKRRFGSHHMLPGATSTSSAGFPMIQSIPPMLPPLP